MSAEHEQHLWDQAFAAAYPLALHHAFKGYGHICESVLRSANAGAAEAADSFIQFRAKRLAGEP